MPLANATVRDATNASAVFRAFLPARLVPACASAAAAHSIMAGAYLLNMDFSAPRQRLGLHYYSPANGGADGEQWLPASVQLHPLNSAIEVCLGGCGKGDAAVLAAIADEMPRKGDFCRVELSLADIIEVSFLEKYLTARTLPRSILPCRTIPTLCRHVSPSSTAMLPSPLAPRLDRSLGGRLLSAYPSRGPAPHPLRVVHSW